MDYNAGRLLSSKLSLKISSTKPHLLEPLYFYKQFLQVMNKYNIGKTEIQTIKLRQMYYWIIEKQKSQTNMSSFCISSKETVSRLFLTYVKLNSVWDFIIHLIFKLTGYTISMMISNFFFFDFSFLNISYSQKQINAVVFLLSIKKHSIWTHRNQIVHKGIAINSNCIIKKIASMIISRPRAEKYRKKTEI